MSTIRASAAETQRQVRQLSQTSPLELLYKMKFEKTGFDPLNPARRLNLIEQLNQIFTYVASFRAADYLYREIDKLTSLTLNLGTDSGWDIEGVENGGLVAEVFAAVDPRNNRKLEKDIRKVASAKAAFRFVFFMCPGFPSEPQQSEAGVKVISLGCEWP